MAMTEEERNAAVQKAYDQAINLGTGAEKPTYSGTFDQQVQDLYNQIQNRENFSYDLNGDALWNQMKDSYMQSGKQAMKDTMGQASALTGGYGSSYAQSVGQQQYDASLSALTDQIPTLYGMALDRYNAEGDKLNNLYGMAADQANQEYNRYQDALSNYNYDQETAYNRYQDAYNRIMNEDNTAYNREQDAFSRQQALYSNLYSLIGSTGYSPSDDELQAAGMSRAQANALVAAYESAQVAASSRGSGGGGSGSSKNAWENYNASASDKNLLKAMVLSYQNGDSKNSADADNKKLYDSKVLTQEASDWVLNNYNAFKEGDKSVLQKLK